MWELPTELAEYSFIYPRHLWSSGTLPSITSEWAFFIFVMLIIIYLATKLLLSRYFRINQLHLDKDAATLEYSPFYHLAIIILVLSEVDWNIFDLGVWMFSYVGIGILRKAIYTIKYERETLIKNYNYDSKLIKILSNSKTLGLILFSSSLALFLALNFVFMGISIKIINLLVFPLMMLVIDGAFLFLVGAAC